jgi:DNA-binding CsgD family transcriptional regulator
LIALYQGNVRRGFALLEQALARYRAGSDPQPLSRCLLHLAMATFIHGRPARYGEQALALAEAHRLNWQRWRTLWTAGVERLLHGDTGRATALLIESLRFRRSPGETIEEPWRVALGLEGLAWVAAVEEHERAARLLGAADAVWRSTGALRTAAFLAGPHGRYEAQVRRALGEPAFTAAFQHGAGLATDQAIAYALGCDPVTALPRPATPASVLTRREREVAELVAQGLSNRDIAAKLQVAQRTAERHVENILIKLGFTSRTQIAAWHLSVHQHGDS